MPLARPLLLAAAAAAALALLAPGASEATCTPTFAPSRQDRPSAVRGGHDATTTLATCSFSGLQVTPNPVSPNATATFDGSGSFGESGTSADIARYDWVYGDGATASTLATDPSPAITSHAYATRGRYTASLTTYDVNGDELAASAPLDVVVDDPPLAALSAPSGTLRPGVSYGFDASGSSSPDAADGGTVVRYDWDWGDGTTATSVVPTVHHTFAGDGTPRVTVTVTDDLGLTASASASLTVFDQLPLVTLVAMPSTVQVGEPVRLDASGSSDPDGSIAEYRWDLDGNASFETSTGTTPTVTVAAGYPNPGPISLSVKVIDDSGGSSVKGVTVTVVAPPGDDGGSGSGGSGASGSGAGSGSGTGGTGATGGSSSGSGGSSGASAGSAPAPFSVGLSGSAIQRLKAALRRGVGLLAVANRAASGKLTMTVTARDAKALHIPGRHGNRPVAIGTLKLSLRAGRTAKPSIKLTRAAARALARAKPRTLRVTIRGSLAAGGASAAVVRVVLLRG